MSSDVHEKTAMQKKNNRLQVTLLSRVLKHNGAKEGRNMKISSILSVQDRSFKQDKKWTGLTNRETAKFGGEQ
jgi:hypothetical protein